MGSAINRCATFHMARTPVQLVSANLRGAQLPTLQLR
jgi:hypothetical protein